MPHAFMNSDRIALKNAHQAYDLILFDSFNCCNT